MKAQYLFRSILCSIFLLVTVPQTVLSHGVAKHGKAEIISPGHNSQISNPVVVKLKASGIMIAPVGVNKHKSGHFIVLVDVDQIDLDNPVPQDKQHIHLSAGETHIKLNLPPGTHSLQAVVADEEHEPFEQLLSEKITIQVVK